MQDIVSPLQSISYTKKDFQTIYPELLDLVKELTNKWDPSISNESDPGVILIKLNALIADKCNYNIDKNVLECFPLSVTQTHNARQLFEQLGYYMKWYRSATAFVSLKWIGEVKDFITCNIPAFTMITDEEKTVVYTITGYIPSESSTEFSIGNVDLPQNGTTVNVKCIQGIAVKYDINGDTVITPQHLDSENRIYFNNSNIAENGIFITNIGSSNYGEWERKDNLLIEDFGNYYYKFGVTADGTSCYLEFPEDCESIMKDGIEITYIKSDGQFGNITPNQLTNFYSDLSVVSSIGDNVVLNSDNVKIKNYFASTDGQDYENIDDAYKNYKRVVGTFNTLVTLRDYFNYIVSNNLVSNGFVCDRSNDLQNVYNILSYSNGVNQANSIVESVDNDPTLTAFSIKLYLTKYYQDVSTTNTYNGTFQPVGETETENIQQYVEDIKSLQHDFVPLSSPNDKFSHFCMFKNKYPVICNIIPQYAISTAQKQEVIKNIKSALYQYLNAQEIEFGDKISSDYLYRVILQADNRIKNIILDNINYTTYAVYYNSDSHLFYEVQVSGDIPDSSEVDSRLPSLKNAITVDTSKFINKLVATRAFTNYAPVEFTYNSGWKIGSTSVTLSQYGITITGYSPQTDDSFTVRLSKQTQFRNEILAKSILAGITPLLIHEEQFDYQMNQSATTNLPALVDDPSTTVDPIITDIVSIFPKVSISIAKNVNSGTYNLRDNETIQLFAPNLLPQRTYNNYVKFECKFNQLQNSEDKIIAENTIYQLEANEYIVFYWKASSSDTLYSYDMYGEGSIIKSSFPLQSNTSTSVATSLYTQMNSQTTLPKELSSDEYPLGFNESQIIQSLKVTDNILSDNKSIQNLIINSVTITNSMYCYWVLNQSAQYGEVQNYVLFEENQNERILANGEYFFYTNTEMTNLITLGEGTLIRKGDPSSPDSWTVSAVPLTDITLLGVDALDGYWYKPQSYLMLTEEQFITVNSGYQIKFVRKQEQQNVNWTVLITDEGTTFSNDLSYKDFKISYRLDGTDQFNDIPDLNLGSDLGWQGKSLLGLNISRTSYQRLLDNQTVIVTKLDETKIKITGAAYNNTSQSPNIHHFYPVTLLADKDLYTTGASEISTISYNNYYDISYLSLYVFAQEQTRSGSSGNVVYSTNGCVIPIPKGQNKSAANNAIQFTLPEGNYIVPTFLPHYDGIYFKVGILTEIGGTITWLAPIYDSSMKVFEGGKLYPLVISMGSGYTNYQLRIQLYSNSAGTTAVNAPIDMTSQFFNPLRYIPTDELARNVALVKMFDDNDIFNYTYEVPDDILIKDPLEAKQFLNSNHIYKKFTICQLDTSSNTRIQVN